LHSCRKGKRVKDVRDVKPAGVYIYMETRSEGYESLPYGECVSPTAQPPVEKPQKKKRRKKRRPDAAGGGGQRSPALGQAGSDAGSTPVVSSEAGFAHAPISPTTPPVRTPKAKGGKRPRRTGGPGGGDAPPARSRRAQPTEEEAALAIQAVFRGHKVRQSIKAGSVSQVQSGS